MKKTLGLAAVAATLLTVTLIQFMPPPPLILPAEAAPGERDAKRILPFEGIANFRDLGGYETVDGRRVRWGRLYRSGALTEASDWDLAQLQRLNLSLLVDFRSAAERAKAPDHLPEQHRFQVLPIPLGVTSAEALAAAIRENPAPGAVDPEAAMLSNYRHFATDLTPEFRRFVHAVRDAQGRPVLWHCEAGKDQSGFAAAILLRLLGVPEELVNRDYLTSAELNRAAHSRELRLLRLFHGDAVAERANLLLGVEKTWLDTAFAAIDQRWGSFDNYIRDGLRLDGNDVGILRGQLLY
jgi:protein-tyrosine phosphatase